jgi:hypothetical protein
MLQGGRDPDLAAEALGAEHGGELGPEHLDGDLGLVAQVAGQIYGGHSTVAHGAFDLVAIAQGGLQGRESVQCGVAG